MTDIFKKTINRILTLFPFPKIHPKLYYMGKEAEQVALLSEINTEKIKSMREPPEWIKEHFKGIKKEDVKLYIDGKEVKGSEEWLTD